VNRLAFSTLACPGWSLEEVVDAAVSLGYAGLELRLLDGVLLPAELDAKNRRRVGRLLIEAGISVAAVDTSIRLSQAVNVAELQQYLVMADTWEAPVVRVFPGQGAPDELRRGLDLAAETAEGFQAGVGVETHDGYTAAAVLGPLIREVESARIGVIWDMLHTHRAGEAPAAVLEQLGDRMLGVHIKDARRQGKDGWQLVPLGEGEVPVRTGIDQLARRNYAGWLVVEWEKMWHPELAEPGMALAHEVTELRRLVEPMRPAAR
jgi:sugar phosphate isomerase/epimerase